MDKKGKLTELETSLSFIIVILVLVLIIFFIIVPTYNNHKERVIDAQWECWSKSMDYIDYKCKSVCNSNSNVTGRCGSFVKRCSAMCGYRFN